MIIIDKYLYYLFFIHPIYIVIYLNGFDYAFTRNAMKQYYLNVILIFCERSVIKSYIYVRNR